MPVITISIIRSPIELVAGIPRTIEFETNVPATVFYTLDGSDPDLYSSIGVGKISLPTDQNSITLKAFATDGTDTSPIVIFGYGPSWSANRNPRDKVIGLCVQPLPNDDGASSFGSSSPNPYVKYGNIGGITVDSPNIDGPTDGFDGSGDNKSIANPDQEYNRQNYDIVYSTKTTTSGPMGGPKVGNLPAQVRIQVPPPVNNYSDASSKLFDPKALVIIQDGRKPQEDPNMSLINRQFFSLADNEKIRNGSMYFTTGFEGNQTTGSFLRPQYNSKDNTWIFPYRDQETGRWIFSIEPVKKASTKNSMKQILLPSRKFGERKVFKWKPFKRSILT